MNIRVGIVGAGGNTRLRHIPGLQAIPGVEVVSVCNRSRESSARVARQFGIPKVYEHWQDLVAAKDVDAIVTGTWPNLHCPVTLEALAAGKHVLTEARMARNLKEAQAMLAAAQQRPRLVAQVVPAPFTLRVDPTVRRLLGEKFIGDALAVEVRASSGFIDCQAPLHWRQDRELSGLNIMSLGIWYESVMRWVGPATRVLAAGKVFVPLRRDPASGVMREVSIPEHLNVIADLPRGAQLHLMISSVAGLTGGPDIWVFGSEGTLRFREDKLFGGRRNDKELREIPIPADEESRWRVEEEFIGAIRGTEPVRLTTFADGVKYMAFTEAVARSLDSQTAVALPV